VCHQPFDSFRSRVQHARQCGDLYFASLISKETIESVFGEATLILGSARVYNTSVTLWVFLSQVMSIHHGCVSAVAKLIAYLAATNQRTCSPKTGAYCIARDKLDEDSMHRLVKASGQAIEAKCPDSWLWLGHQVITADGATVTMADTADNQAAYPQLSSQAPGCGFPIVRVVVLFALSSGVVLDMALGRYKGKLTHEVNLFRQIDEIIGKDDVFLADRAYAGWFDMARIIGRGAHVVVRKHQMRKSDFRRGTRHGKDDHSIKLSKPDRPEWMSQEEYDSYPELITIREIKIRVANKGFRTREIIVHTSLRNVIEYSQDDIGALFRRRWQAELNLRSLKTVMQMEHLRCKKPHRVRNEIRAHMLAYNLVRGVMVEAAADGDVQPWQISFKATLTTISDMLPVLGLSSQPEELCGVLLRCCWKHAVGNRPDRYEPRVLKRRQKKYKLMQKPRREYKPGEA
jgi:hypothetical protein